MQSPKMILFDAGRTLIDYTSADTLKGVKALMPYITSNPRRLSAEYIDRYTNQVFGHFEKSRKQLFEVPAQTILALVYNLLELKFSISVSEIEQIIWNEDSEIIALPHVKELIDELKKRGIQTAVISNLDFSGYLLKARLDQLFPDNSFAFVIASSDYGIRKPDPLIFEAGIAKSGYARNEIWYIGDKLSVDVFGSKNAGMVPILYKSPRNHYDQIPEDLLAVDDLLEVLELIDQE